MTALLALFASPLWSGLVAAFGVPALGGLLLTLFQSKPVLGIAGSVSNACKGFGIATALWAKTGPLKAIFGPVVFLLVAVACCVLSWLDGVLSRLDGDNLKLAQAVEAAFGEAGSSDRLGYVQAKLDPPAPPPIEGPGQTLDEGQIAVMQEAVDAGQALQASRTAQT